MLNNATTTTLIIIRHGETEWNRAGRIQGHSDSALTAEGIDQATACAARLKDDGIDHVISSDLGRARHTATLLNRHLQRPVQYDAALRERCFGIAEGSTYAELETTYPELFSRVREVDQDYTVDGAESRAVFHRRVVHAVEHIAADHIGKRVLMVTHGGVLGAIHRWLHQLPISSPHKIDIPNVGYNRIVQIDGVWRIEAWGDVSHYSPQLHA